MATAYHLEALRKQRVLDRANEAKEKLASTEIPDETQAEVSPTKAPPSGNGSRPLSAQSAVSKRSSCASESTDQPEEGRRSSSGRINRPASASSRHSNAPSTAGSLSSKQTASSTGSTKHSTVSSSRRSRPSTAPPSGRKELQHSRQSSASSRASEERLSRLNTAELKAELVRRDLLQQEKVLRDSNLVMGEVSVKDEMETRQLDPGDTSV